jgi:hypothetical protein
VPSREVLSVLSLLPVLSSQLCELASLLKCGRLGHFSGWNDCAKHIRATRAAEEAKGGGKGTKTPATEGTAETAETGYKGTGKGKGKKKYLGSWTVVVAALVARSQMCAASAVCGRHAGLAVCAVESHLLRGRQARPRTAAGPRSALLLRRCAVAVGGRSFSASFDFS